MLSDLLFLVKKKTQLLKKQWIHKRLNMWQLDVLYDLDAFTKEDESSNKVGQTEK